jgi:YidC/Oxa1 family membrane protein insertase
MPIFFGLFYTLSNAAQEIAGVGLLSSDLAKSFGEATIFGTAGLASSMSSANGNMTILVVAGVMVVIMTVSQFITQKQIMSKNQSDAMKESPMYKQQQVLLYILPLVFMFSGWAFPLGVMFYWLVSNIWTMVQQFIVIRNMPTPGSQAHREWEARNAKKAERKGLPTITEAPSETTEEAKPVQRQQPVSKARAKKQQGKK